jgi:hypothetical protein
MQSDMIAWAVATANGELLVDGAGASPRTRYLGEACSQARATNWPFESD